MRRCRCCGCTETQPCVQAGAACAWVADDLCSSCFAPLPENFMAFALEQRLMGDPPRPGALGELAAAYRIPLERLQLALERIVAPSPTAAFQLLQEGVGS